MRDYPKSDQSVLVTIQGETSSHNKNWHLKKGKNDQYRRKGHPRLIGFSDDFPDRECDEDVDSLEDLEQGTESDDDAYADTDTEEKDPETVGREKLHKKYKRSKRDFMRKFSTMKSIPTLFSSLSMDKNKHKELGVDVDVDFFLEVFTNFKRYIRDKYLAGWFFWKIEWSENAFLHIHIVGNTGSDESLKTTRAYIKEKWDHCCQHNVAHESANFVSALTKKYRTDGARSYFFKKIKVKDDKKCMEILDGFNLFGKIRGANIVAMKPNEFMFSRFELIKYYRYIIKELEKDAEDKKKKRTISLIERRYDDSYLTANFLGDLPAKSCKRVIRLRKKIFGKSYDFRRIQEWDYIAYKLAPTINVLLDTHDGEWQGTSKEFFKEFMKNATDLSPQYAKRLRTPESLVARVFRAQFAWEDAGIEFKKRRGADEKIAMVKVKRLAE